MKKISANASVFLSPPALFTEKGTRRHVGFEMEFSGLGISDIADTVLELFGGTVYKINPYKLDIHTVEYGTFTIELDFRLLKESILKEKFEDFGVYDSEVVTFFEEILATLSEFLVPYEIATPPILIDNIAIVDQLAAALRARGAVGTKAQALYAFGMHINPEVPSFDTFCVLSHLRAFLLLYEWIVRQTKTDIFRQVMPYINPFEKEYVKLVLAPEYMPGISRLIDDYLLYNPTRNRPLDLLPLFMYMEEALVRTFIDDPKVKARPTFHYRLPDCRIDEPEHSVAEAWNYWVEVERLAADPQKVTQMSREYLVYLEDPFSFIGLDWANKTEAWLK